MSALARWRAAGLVLPTLMTLALLPVLLGLGTWQWQRKAWKEGLIARLEARRTMEPVSYAQALSQLVRDGDVEYLRVRVSGHFDHATERHLYAPTRKSQGWHVYTLFEPDGGLPLLLVNRGWVPDTRKDPAGRMEGQVAGPVTVTGLVRIGDKKGLFDLENDIGGNRWYWRDLDAMRWGASGVPSVDHMRLNREKASAPFSLDAEADPGNPGGWPLGGSTEIRLPNNHLQYVVTWYGLAATLLGVFVVYARQRLAALDRGALQP